jgi:predicted HTH transcriptional regulator
LIEKRSLLNGFKSRDDFSEGLQDALERGSMEGISGEMFKSMIISEVQEYSRKIASEQEPLSTFFLNLCDLILEGHVSRMPDSALKVYVILNIYRCMMRDEKSTLEILKQVSGLPVRDIRRALEYLVENGLYDQAGKSG